MKLTSTADSIVVTFKSIWSLQLYRPKTHALYLEILAHLDRYIHIAQHRKELMYGYVSYDDHTFTIQFIENLRPYIATLTFRITDDFVIDIDYQEDNSFA